MVDGFVKGEYDKVEIISNEFKNAVQQKLNDRTIFTGHSGKIFKQEITITDYIFEPSSDEIVSVLVPKHLISRYGVFCLIQTQRNMATNVGQWKMHHECTRSDQGIAIVL